MVLYVLLLAVEIMYITLPCEHLSVRNIVFVFYLLCVIFAVTFSALLVTFLLEIKFKAQ